MERTYIKSVRFNKKELIDLMNRVNASGLDASVIIRLALKNQSIREKPPREFYDLLNKINNIGTNINQIAHIANANGEIYYDDLKIYYKEILKFINEVRMKYL